MGYYKTDLYNYNLRLDPMEDPNPIGVKAQIVMRLKSIILEHISYVNITREG